MTRNHRTHLEERIDTLVEEILDLISRHHIVMRDVASDVGVTPSRLSALLHQGATTPHVLHQLEEVKEVVDWYVERERARKELRKQS